MKTPILLKSALIGILIIIVLSAISMGVTFPMMQEMFAIFSDPAFFDPGTAPPSGIPPGFEQFVSLWPLLGLLSCLTMFLPGMIAGGLYARWHNQEKPIIPGAIKGAAATGALAYVIGSTIAGFVSLAFILPLQMQMMETAFATAGAPPTPFPLGGSMVLFGAIGLVCGAIFQAIFGAGFGALGGLIGDSITKDKSHDYAGGDVIG